MMNDCLFLRKANKEDMDILFEWVNDPEARRNAFDTHIISYDEHREWFERMMDDPEQIQFILVLEGKPIGQIRLSIDNDAAEIDYSIDPQKRHMGFGKKIIRLLIDRVKTDYPYVKKIIGRVKPHNTASYRCFLDNGFDEKYTQLEYLLYD